MNRRLEIARLVPASLLALALAGGIPQLHADAGGRTGRAKSASGCSCHNSSATKTVVVSISGPQSVMPSSTHAYTVTVSGGPSGSNGGFDLNASAGTLGAGAGSYVLGLDVTHLDPSRRSWTFQWTAPAMQGAQNFYAIAVAADGSGDEGGDEWNWYGSAVNTAFPIQVSSTLDASLEAGGEWLAPATPNPMLSQARVTFALANAGPIRLEAFDISGRKVATLAKGSYPAGTHSLVWTGIDAGGQRIADGLYFLRLRTASRELTSRVMVRR
ncbi:MAG: choice-of-anchor V domain-containing protein [Candidatus Eiseniibacteriota bacterium]